MNNEKIIIYTDGACSGNPGQGGWAGLLIYKDTQKEVSGYEEYTTNNKMELMAVIQSLSSLKKEKCDIEIHTDSKYVMNGIESWIKNWKKNNWMTSAKKPVKNKELWEELDLKASQHYIKWHWVKGHSGNKYNDIVDNMARLAINQLKK